MYTDAIRGTVSNHQGSVDGNDANDDDGRSTNIGPQRGTGGPNLALRHRQEKANGSVPPEEVERSIKCKFPICGKLRVRQPCARQGCYMRTDDITVEIPGAAGWTVPIKKRKVPPKENWSRSYKKREKGLLIIRGPEGRRIDGLRKLKRDANVGMHLKRRIGEFSKKIAAAPAGTFRTGTDSVSTRGKASTSGSVVEEENDLDEPDEMPDEGQNAAELAKENKGRALHPPRFL